VAVDKQGNVVAAGRIEKIGNPGSCCPTGFAVVKFDR
jgi:hypothetical protein